MKITHIIQKPVPTPPNRVILDMTEEEAGKLFWIVNNYRTIVAGNHSESADRLQNFLHCYKDCRYEDSSKYFQIEE